jgi:WD40 repeat protein
MADNDNETVALKQIEYHGVSSGRSANVAVLDDGQLAVGCSCSLSTFQCNFSERRVRKTNVYMALHESLISVVMALGGGAMLTADYGGTIKIWRDRNFGELICSAKVQNRAKSLLDIDERRLNGDESLLCVCGGESARDSDLSLLRYSAGKCELVQIVDEKSRCCWSSQDYGRLRFARFICRSDDAAMTAIAAVSDRCVVLVDVDSMATIDVFALDSEPSFACAMPSCPSMLLVACNRSLLLIEVRASKLVELERVDAVAGTGALTTLSAVADGERSTALVLPSQDGRLYSMQCSTAACDNGRRRFVVADVAPSTTAALVPAAVPTALVAGKNGTLFCVTDSAVHCCSTSSVAAAAARTEDDCNLFALTCCGLALSPGGSLAAGDFLGTLRVWPAASGSADDVGGHHHQHSLGSAVRALLWLNDRLLVASTMDGVVHGTLGRDRVVKLAAFDAAVTSLALVRASSSDDDGDNASSYRVAAGTTGGELALLDVSVATLSATVTQRILAHRPQPRLAQDRRALFGSLPLFAEIWSVAARSKGARLLATASEDQSCCVFRIDDSDDIVPLGALDYHRHENAVTCLDWRRVPGFGELLCSCSDDNSVRVSRLLPSDDDDNAIGIDSFEPLCTLTTGDATAQFHTLTYVLFDCARARVIAASENGYLFVWSLRTRRLLLSTRVHCGSIEGLAIDEHQNRLATVASDCSLLIFSL